MPPDVLIVVDGYEGGVSRVHSEMVALVRARPENTRDYVYGVYITREGHDVTHSGLFGSWDLEDV